MSNPLQGTTSWHITTNDRSTIDLSEGEQLSRLLPLCVQPQLRRFERHGLELFELAELLAAAGHALELFALRPEAGVDGADGLVVLLDRLAERLADAVEELHHFHEAVEQLDARFVHALRVFLGALRLPPRRHGAEHGQ